MARVVVANPDQLTQPFSPFAAETSASEGFRKFQRSAPQDTVRCRDTWSIRRRGLAYYHSGRELLRQVLLR
jgi:hypothetical protein